MVNKMKEQKNYKHSKTFEKVDGDMDKDEYLDLLDQLYGSLHTHSATHDETVEARAERTESGAWSVSSKVMAKGTGVFASDGYMGIEYTVGYGDPSCFENYGDNAFWDGAWVGSVDVTICADEQATFDKLHVSVTTDLEKCEFRRLENIMSSCCNTMIQQMDITGRYEE